MRFSLRLSVLVLCLLSLAGCTPEFNWRQTSPPGSGATLLFPCRPRMDERTVRIAGSSLRMQMHSCRAGGVTFSLAFADVGEPTQVAVVLAALRLAAEGNLGGAISARPWTARGATPNQQSALVRIDGHLPDGKSIVEHTAFFVKGLRLYQATALGDSLDADALDSFFDSIEVVS
jgi:hypothetical protein